jgi:nitronate monooxygenase
MTDLLRKLRIGHPIIQAPMAGGPSTPLLAAAVSNASALGSLGCAYLTPEGIANEIEETRRLTKRPFSINLFAGGYHTQLDRDPQLILEVLAPIHMELGLPAPVVPDVPADPFETQVETVLRLRPEVFSFTFGIPSADVLRELRSAGIVIIGTATTVAEAQMLEDAGVDAIAAQGAEAGAHRGTFLGTFADSMVPMLDLVRQIASATKTPVIASGGIMNGAEIGRALDAGAQAVQLGTAFLGCPEAGTGEAYREALSRATGDDTVITRAYSGRPARGIRNTFIELVGESDERILPFPIQNSLTRPMRTAAAKAGTGVAKLRTMPAAELVATLVRELETSDGPRGDV